MPFSASASFRGLPACPFMEAVTETQRSNAGFPCNIRILWKFRLFLAAVGFRGLPLAIPSLTM